jgi:hypothetical protein
VSKPVIFWVEINADLETAVVALTGIWDWFDGDRSKDIQQRAVMVLPGRYVNHEPLPIFGGPGQKVGGKGPPP